MNTVSSLLRMTRGNKECPAYGWVVLGTFTLNYALVVISIMALGLLLPEISDELSLSPSQQGWLASSVLFGNLLFEIPANWWFSRYRPWRVAAVSFGTAVLFLVFNAWAPTFGVLLVARVGLGLAYLSSQAPRTLVVLQWMPEKHFGLANGVLFGSLEMLIGIGLMVIPLVMVWLDGWRNTLYAWAGVCVVGGGLWLVLGRDRVTPQHREHLQSQEKTPLGSLFKYREPWIMGLGVAGAAGGQSAIGAFWPTFTGDEYGTAVTFAGLIVGLNFLASAPGQLGVTVFPFFAHRTPMILMVSGVGLCASYVGMLFTGSQLFLVLLGVASGISFCFIPPIMAALYRLGGIKPREVAVAVGLTWTLLWGGSALGPLIAGFVEEATGDLRLGLIITSMAPLALTASGLALSGRGREEIGPGLEPVPGPR